MPLFSGIQLRINVPSNMIPGDTGSLRHMICRILPPSTRWSLKRCLTHFAVDSRFLAVVVGILYHLGWRDATVWYTLVGPLLVLFETHMQRRRYRARTTRNQTRDREYAYSIWPYDIWGSIRRLSASEPYYIFFIIRYLPKHLLWGFQRPSSTNYYAFITFSSVGLLSVLYLLWEMSRLHAISSKGYYQYSRNDTLLAPESVGKIRLLELHPWRPFSGVRATLHTIHFAKAPPYQAISYTWRSPNKAQTITINGLSFKTTQASYDALRDSIWWTRPRFLWIDYICINQDDDLEKNVQVPLMRQIYSKATKVIVHLSSPPKGSGLRAVWKRLASSKDITVAMNIANDMALEKEPISGWRKLSPGAALIHESESIKGVLNTLCAHTWFQRIWVVQEVCVADDVEFRYEHHSLRWQAVSAIMAHFLEEMGDYLNLSGPTGRQAFQNACHFQLISEHRASSRSRYPRFDYNGRPVPSEHNELNSRYPVRPEDTLCSFLVRSQGIQATDARDKVYALLGLAQDDSSAYISVDYATKTAREVFIEAALYFCYSDSPFYLLGYAGIGSTINPSHRIAGLPSWAVDWSLPRDCPSLEQPLSPYYYKVCYKAAIEVDVRFDLDEESEVLKIGGLCIDTITSLGSVCDFENGHIETQYKDTYGTGFVPSQIAAVIEWHDEAFSLAAANVVQRPKSDDSLREAFWRTLCGDKDGGYRPADISGVYCYDTWIADARELHQYFLRDGDSPRPIMKHTVGANSVCGQAMGFCASGRRFGVTEKGRMGMWPPGTVVGDSVAILFGCVTPFVLRENGDSAQHVLVGECYVRGMMDGEALKDLTEGDLKQDLYIV
jgi:hypothetical protein